MKKISITGGKGGTGKSTSAVLWARKLAEEGKKVILCDCDIECPNDYLLLQQELKEPEKSVTAEFPKLDKEKCDQCGLCVRACRNNAIFQAPGRFPMFIKDLCSGCGACWSVCPKKAIQREEEEIGWIYFNNITKFHKSNDQQTVKGEFFLVTGVAKPGLEETGPIVADTKRFTLELADRMDIDIVLFDTAVGTHCPVINALIDTDVAYAVTEPTPMGAYDLDLILQLCQRLGVPTKVILNQADLGDKKTIEKVVRKYETEIDRTMPYSKVLARAYAKGQLLNLDISFIH